MLTKTEYLLTLVGEECAEIAQRASKAIRFGLHETQPGQAYDNARRLMMEVIDLKETLEELIYVSEIDFPTDVEILAAARRVKMMQYLERAQAEGRVEA
jgi:hypothetical protein